MVLRRMVRISNLNGEKSVLHELQTRGEILDQIVNENGIISTCRQNTCNLVKTCMLGMMPGKRKGRTKM